MKGHILEGYRSSHPTLTRKQISKFPKMSNFSFKKFLKRKPSHIYLSFFIAKPPFSSISPNLTLSLSTQAGNFPFAILISTSPAAWQPSLGQQQHLQPQQRGATWVEAHRVLAVRSAGQAGERTNLQGLHWSHNVDHHQSHPITTASVIRNSGTMRLESHQGAFWEKQ